ncbi:enoyl-CoA hydratase [Mycolicibacterium mucogenicum]|uniref:Enoyl-CoA hydratase n=1 Tax=Mycolicibacterium mucogenicum TaxID=56689 RepID=A0A1A3HFI6_MYCMU|nr:crotonase/enoyl-CoA hydratase family protein [Mycolicibacterium mucogenicum]OBJ46449.1 enoyl-CoA hydratase [Mycolicibacterium mucogenicum]
MTDYQDIIYEVGDGRARIILNRPRRHNAITDVMTREIEAALWDADDDTSVHSIIIKGAGLSFCSGYDLDAYGDHSEPRGERRGRAAFDDRAWQLEKMQRPLRAFHDIHKPVIAQVHGHCLAGGTGIAMFCDMVIVADDANFGFPAARAGTLPNQMWLYSAGPQWTKRLTLTGDTVSGEDAARLGLALKSVPHELLETEVEGLADRLAHVDIDLLSANKRIVNIGVELMGAQILQRMAAEMDTRAHLSDSTEQFLGAIGAHGLKPALADRDKVFGDGRARVTAPEIRDAQGNLAQTAQK